MKTENTRNNYIDFLRGLAIILMIFGHMIDYGLVLDVCISEQKQVFQYIHNFIYSFHMPFFFTISGYAMAMRDNTIDSVQLLWLRIKRAIVSLYIPYLCFVVLYWIARFSASRFLGCQLVDPLETNVSELAYLLIAGKSLSWFLLSLLLVRVVFDIVRYFGNTNWCFWVFVIIAGLNIVVSNRPIYYLSYGLFFAIGYIVSRNKIFVCTKSVLFGALTIAFLCLLGLGTVFLGRSEVFDLVIAVILSTIPVLIKPNLKENYICEVGKNSMVFYISHGIVNGICITILYSVLGMQYNLVLSIVGVLFQLIVITVLLRIIENKHFYWISYLFYPQRSKLVKKYIIG